MMESSSTGDGRQRAESVAWELSKQSMQAVNKGMPPMSYAHPDQPLPKRPRLKRVSWASDDRLRQVRLFSAEDAPCMAGESHQQGFLRETKKAPGLDLPPGFGKPGTAGVRRVRTDSAAVAAVVVQLPWRTPQPIELNSEWQVVAGGGSEEVAAQQEREKRTLEAIYPRLALVPDNPQEPLELQEEYDDSLTPVIPIVAVEDEDAGDHQDTDMAGAANYSTSVNLTEVNQRQSPKPTVSAAPWEQASKSTPQEGSWGGASAQKEGSAAVAPSDAPSESKGVGEGTLQEGGFTHAPPSFSSSLPSRAPPSVAPTDPAPVSEGQAANDVTAAAAAAIATMSDSGLIDKDLLLQILADPSMIAAAMAMQGQLARGAESLPSSDQGAQRGQQLAPPGSAPTGSSGSVIGRPPAAAHIVPTGHPSADYLPINNGSRDTFPRLPASVGDQLPRHHSSLSDALREARPSFSQQEAGSSEPTFRHSQDMGAGPLPNYGMPRPPLPSAGHLGAPPVMRPPYSSQHGELMSKERPLPQNDGAAYPGALPYSSKPQYSEVGPRGEYLTARGDGPTPLITSNEKLNLYEQIPGRRDSPVLRSQEEGPNGYIPTWNNPSIVRASGSPGGPWDSPRENEISPGAYLRPEFERPGERFPNASGRRGRGRGRVCVYYPTARGCRNGSTCPFVHEGGPIGGGASRGRGRGEPSERDRGVKRPPNSLEEGELIG